MYESEANHLITELSEIEPEVLARFAEARSTVLRRSLIPWGEHCTECVWPTCYSTCDLYESRKDGGCRRFAQGMVRIDYPASVSTYLLKISFKRWAKLWSLANIRLYSLEEADRLERRDIRIANYIHSIPSVQLQGAVTRKRYSWKKQVACRAEDSPMPACMLIECFNPNASGVAITLTIRNESSQIPFQSLLQMQLGFNRHRIPCADIARVIDLHSKFNVELTPNGTSDGLTLYFGALDFVLENGSETLHELDTSVTKTQPRMRKAVVWDLDNTIWDGILVEDGPEQLRIKPGIREIFQALDDRGILISAVSKNNREDAMAALKQFGIADYFLSPQLSWNPKSQAIQQLAVTLNIGIDSLLFVDDSKFEREQVKNACPGVEVLDAADYLTIPGREDCHGPITEESRKRRQLYRQQEVRDTVQSVFEGDYVSFLRDCKLQLTVRRMSSDSLERVYELTQRTNQMNFSGNRYTREQVHALLSRQEVDAYVLDCEDRFGAYGTIGFCTVNRPELRMTDLMFSCRVQSKRVEHAFISYILRKYRNAGAGDFFVMFRKTHKNSGPGKVFEDFKFELINESDGISNLVFRRERDIPDDQIVEIDDVMAT